MLKRPVYEQIGGLDEDIFLFTEEADFCERAFQAGWLTYYVPAATLRTTSRPSYRDSIYDVSGTTIAAQYYSFANADSWRPSSF